MLKMQQVYSARRENPTLNSRILIVEDHEVNRRLLMDYICYLGYQVFTIGEGSTFFQAISQFQPHLILLDLKLPGIDGYTLLQLLQQQSDWQKVPVIVVSAYAFKADRERALSLGAKRYFVKPVNLAQLRQAIQEELQEMSG